MLNPDVFSLMCRIGSEPGTFSGLSKDLTKVIANLFSLQLKSIGSDLPLLRKTHDAFAPDEFAALVEMIDSSKVVAALKKLDKNNQELKVPQKPAWLAARLVALANGTSSPVSAAPRKRSVRPSASIKEPAELSNLDAVLSLSTSAMKAKRRAA
jgi:hypothetical protein